MILASAIDDIENSRRKDKLHPKYPAETAVLRHESADDRTNDWSEEWRHGEQTRGEGALMPIHQPQSLQKPVYKELSTRREESLWKDKGVLTQPTYR